MQQRSEETRARISQAAIEHFSRLGYEAASVDEICAAAGVSKGAFYHHYPTKQALFLALLQSWLDGLDGQFAAIRAQGSDAGQVFLGLTATLPGIFRDADQRLPMFLEFWAQASRDPQVWQAMIEPYRRYRTFFAELFEQGVQDGTFGPVDPQVAARLVVALAVGVLLQGLLDPDQTDWQRFALQSMKIMMNGLGNPK